MALPPLDHVLSPVPAYGLTTPLERIALALGQLGAVPPSHIVVVDGQQRPLGAIALGWLWAASQGALPLGGATEGSTGASPLRLADCQAWLEPVVAVIDREWGDRPTITQLRAMALEPAPALWVCTSADGRYRGVLNPVKLMAWLSAPDPVETGHIAAPPLGLGQQAWVLELGHALKTPMTTLLGLSTLLLDSRVGSLSDRQFRYVSLMRQAIRKLTGLINLLLDWMRLESGQLGLSLERVDLKPLADELLPGFLSAQPETATAAWAEEFTVCLAIAEDWVQADPLRLRQSLHYGLGYLLAYGATPGGLVIEPWGPWLGLTLWSSTCIVDPSSLPEPPSALGLEIQPVPQSLEGLGLALARRFSQLQGGELSGLSAPTVGSRMTLLLPQPDPPREGETVLVLLASASQSVVDRVYSGLRGSPYRLAVAPGGQALAVMQTRLAPHCTLIHWEGLADAPIDAAAQMALVQRLKIPRAVVLRSAPRADGGAIAPDSEAAPIKTLYLETLTQELQPTLDQICRVPSLFPQDGLTMLLLRPSAAAGPGTLPLLVHTWLQRYHCRLLQVDDLQQASLLSRVWRPQAVILDGVEAVSIPYLQDFARQPDLAELPLITLVAPTSEAAAVALGISLIPCPEVLTQPPALAVVSLMRAIARHRTPPEA